TGLAYICVSTAGENFIVVVGGANRAVSARHIRSRDHSGHNVYLSQLETPLDAIEAMFSGARKGTRILNAAPALREAKTLFPLADILVVNQTELARYAEAGDQPMSRSAVVSAARRLISREGQRVIVTLGANGAVAVDAANVIEVAGRKVQPVDTTG